MKKTPPEIPAALFVFRDGTGTADQVNGVNLTGKPL